MNEMTRLVVACAAALAVRVLPAGALSVGPGLEYETVQSAVDAIPPGNTSEAIIEIAPGDYEEHVLLPRDKPFVTMRAKTPGSVRIRSGESVYTVKDKQLPRCAGAFPLVS